MVSFGTNERLAAAVLGLEPYCVWIDKVQNEGEAAPKWYIDIHEVEWKLGSDRRGYGACVRELNFFESRSDCMKAFRDYINETGGSVQLRLKWAYSLAAASDKEWGWIVHPDHDTWPR